MSWALYRIEEYSKTEVAYFYSDRTRYPSICLTGVESNAKGIYGWLRLLGVSMGYVDTDLKLPYSDFGKAGCHEFYSWTPRQRPQPRTTSPFRGPTIGSATTPRKGSAKNCGYSACYNRLLKHPDIAKRTTFNFLIRRVFMNPQKGVGHAQHKIHAMILDESRRCKAGY